MVQHTISIHHRRIERNNNISLPLFVFYQSQSSYESLSICRCKHATMTHHYQQWMQYSSVRWHDQVTSCQALECCPISMVPIYHHLYQSVTSNAIYPGGSKWILGMRYGYAYGVPNCASSCDRRSTARSHVTLNTTRHPNDRDTTTDDIDAIPPIVIMRPRLID